MTVDELPDYPWYAVVSGSELEQGDILLDCPVFQIPPQAVSKPDEYPIVIERQNVIVMTQSCDLAVRADGNFRFVRRLKMVDDPEALDAQVKQLHDEVFDQIDCTHCANCCKTIAPTLTSEDIDRIAAHLALSRQAFLDAHVAHDPFDGDLMKTVPCPFLGSDDRCTIYEVRPEACVRYPFTNQEGFIWRTLLHASNTLTCPAVYHIVERLRHRFKNYPGHSG